MYCKYCSSDKIVKNGQKYDKQRYICKDCEKSFSESDNRIKRDAKQKELTLILYLSNNSIRSIQKTINLYFNTNLCISVLSNWIKNFAKKLKQNLKLEDDRMQREESPKTIKILELDEMYSYFYHLKKNEKNSSKYGLLLIGSETKLLHIR